MHAGLCLRKKDEERSHKDVNDTLLGITYRALLEDDDEVRDMHAVLTAMLVSRTCKQAHLQSPTTHPVA